jgi:hypothetical protein
MGASRRALAGDAKGAVLVAVKGRWFAVALEIRLGSREVIEGVSGLNGTLVL